MKKYYIKTVATFLMIAIFFMVGSLCFDSVFKISEVHAANLENNLDGEVDLCMGGHDATQKEVEESTSANNHNSLLPCCVSGAHPTLGPLTFQITELIKSIPTVFFNEYDTVKTILISAVYYKPITSPPELLALKTTILRI